MRLFYSQTTFESLSRLTVLRFAENRAFRSNSIRPNLCLGSGLDEQRFCTCDGLSETNRLRDQHFATRRKHRVTAPRPPSRGARNVGGFIFHRYLTLVILNTTTAFTHYSSNRAPALCHL